MRLNIILKSSRDTVTEQLNCEVHMHIGISMPIMTWLPLMHSEETGKRGMRT
jgi:hypothetical protein